MARGLYGAWLDGDRRGALAFVASDPTNRQDAVDHLFGSSLRPSAFRFDSCQEGYGCVLTEGPPGGPELHMLIGGRADSGYFVTFVYLPNELGSD